MKKQKQLKLIRQNMERRKLCRVVQNFVWCHPKAVDEHLAAQA